MSTFLDAVALNGRSATENTGSLMGLLLVERAIFPRHKNIVDGKESDERRLCRRRGVSGKQKAELLSFLHCQDTLSIQWLIFLNACQWYDNQVRILWRLLD